MKKRETDYRALTAEELENRLREAFFYPDRIDETVYRELEDLRSALEEKRPAEYEYTPQESWERFQADREEELAELFGPAAPAQARPRKEALPPRRLLRRAVIAAVIVVLLAGAALAADYAGLLAWVPRWNAAAGRYEPAATEVSGESPIPAALRELGITEPVYPAKLPEGFVITESHISEDPLVLMEQYARGDQRLSITITPVRGTRNIVYAGGKAPTEYDAGERVHYLFANEGSITAVWYTENYATTVSGDIPRAEIRSIIDSLYDSPEGGSLA